MKNKNRAFSLVELIIVIALITVFTGLAYINYSSYTGFMKNKRVTNDLTAISHAMSQYYRDHDNSFPVPSPEENPTMNLLCLNADLTPAHNCATAAIVTGMIDESLLTKRYLSEVPRDPRTGARYVYGVTGTGRRWQVAAVIEDKKQGLIAKTVGNLDEDFFLPGLIRAYDSPRFVVNDGTALPYSPDHMTLSARLRNAHGEVTVKNEDGILKSTEDTLYPGDTITTGADGNVDIFFSDGSVTRLDPDTELVITGESAVTENEEDSIATKIYLKLIRGKIWNKVVRLADKSEFNVETTSAIAGVRGTEFGVWDDNTLIVYSGTVWVKEDTDERIVSGTPDAPAQATISADGPEGVAEVTDSALLEYIEDHHIPRTLSEAAVPFITATSGGLAGEATSIYVSFNYKDTNNIYDVDGFEIFPVSGTMNAWTTDVTEYTPLATVTHIEYSDLKRAYYFPMEFTIPAQDNGFPGMFVLRAFSLLPGGEKAYSALSWRPLAIVGKPKSYNEVNDNIDFYHRNLVEITISGPDEVASDGVTSYPYTAGGKFDDLFVKDITHDCSWKSEPEGMGANEFKPLSTGTYTLSCSMNYVTGTKTVAVTNGGTIPKTLADVCTTANGGYWDGTSCWVMGEAGVSCDTACSDFAGANSVTASCNTDTTWNDCGTDGVCGTTAPTGDDGAICLGMMSGDYPGTVLPYSLGAYDYAPFWFDGSGVQNCTPRDTRAVSCNSEPPVISGLTFRRLCSCTE